MSVPPILPLHIVGLQVHGVDAAGDEDVVGDWSVRRFELVERICEPFSLMLSVATTRQIHVAGLVGGRCWFRFGRGEFERDIQGVVFKAETIGFIHGKLCLRLWVVPALEVLRLSRRMRVFEGKTAVDIVRALLTPVFERYGGSLDTSAVDHAEPRIRDRCVQFQETDLAFAQRLLAEEGIAFTFRHHRGDAEDVALMPLTAILHSVAGEDEAEPLPVLLCPQEPELASTETIQNLQGSSSMRAAASEAAMWDWKASPPTRVSGREDPLLEDAKLGISLGRFGEVYEFETYRPVEAEPGGPLFEQSEGEAHTGGHRARIEDVRAIGTANVCGFTDGATFEVSDHPSSDLDGFYVLHSVVHHAEFDVDADGMHVKSTGAYRNRFTCHRFGAPGEQWSYTFSPPRPRKPVVHGPMTATVVGPPGEEIHTDVHGRIKVLLHWDRGEAQRDDHERSCWVPVGQTWAGAGFGAVVVPRVGMEVVIAFAGGDPDRPICTGTVYNGHNEPPYPLPGNKTRSVFRTASSPGGGGFNELSFEDAAGTEEVFLQAQRNLREVVKRSHSTQVGASQTCRVGGDQSNTVGGDQSTIVDKNQSETIKGDVRLEVEGTRSRTITGEETVTLEAARKTYVGDTELHQVTGHLTESFEGGRTTMIGDSDGEVVQSGDKSIAVDGGALTVSAKAAISLTQAGTHTVELKDGATISTTADFTVTNGKVRVSTKDGALSVAADDELSLTCGAASIVLKKDGSIEVQGTKQVAVGTPGTSFVAEPSGAAIHGPKISSQAIGVHEVKGALVKIN